jgi:diguanylate cyclase (GGDEF)-like protein
MAKKVANKSGLEAALPEEIELIYNVALQLGSELDLDKLLKLIVENIKQALHYPHCSILLKEGDDLVVKAITDDPEAVGMHIPFGTGVTGRCAMQKKELLIQDVSKCKFYIRIGDMDYKSEFDIPIIFRDKVLGVLNTETPAVNAYADRDVRILKILSNQIAMAIHNAQAHNQLGLLQDIGIRLVSLMKLEELLALIVQETQHTLHYDSCAIFLVESENLVLKAITNEFPQEAIGLKINIGKGITGLCAREKKIINVADITKNCEYIPSGMAGIRSEIAAPIVLNKELLGILTIESKRLNAFDEDDERFLSILCSQIAVAIRNARSYTEIEKMSITDPMTGLYNYRYFYERLMSEIARSARYHHPLAMIILDLDDFKSINDNFGHQQGDEVLKRVAHALQSGIRRPDETTIMKNMEIDIAARYGGDEFVLILPETNIEGARTTAERLKKILAEKLSLLIPLVTNSEQSQVITGSFGVSALKEGENLEILLKRCDQAMYEAKRQGKNRVCAIP